MASRPPPRTLRSGAASGGSRLEVRFVRQASGSSSSTSSPGKAALVVEVDGDVLHARRAAADARGDEKLRRTGYRVLRIPASLVERDLGQAVEMVQDAL